MVDIFANGYPATLGHYVVVVTEVVVRLYHPKEELIMTYALDDPNQLAAWGWNARHFPTMVIAQIEKMMEPEAAEDFMKIQKIVFEKKQQLIAQMNAGHL